MENKLVIKIILDNFKNSVTSATKCIEMLSDEQIKKEVSPSKNTGHYLLGHLVAVQDNMIPLLGLGESLFPSLVDIFINNSDNSTIDRPSIQQLRSQWTEVNEFIIKKLETFSINDWTEKHNSVSKEDFIKEPHRNKSNVVLNRTNHLAYHVGQLRLLTNNSINK